MINQIIFWQDIPSAHLNFFISEIPNVNPLLSVILVVNSYYSDNRKQMGWEFQKEYPNIKTIVNPSYSDTLRLLSQKSTIHVLSGFKHFPHSKTVLRYLNETKIFGGFLMERPDFWHLKGIFRKWASPFLEKRYSKEAKFVFTFGTEAIDWYSKHGFSSDHVFPFLYTVPIITGEKAISYYKPNTKSLEVAFIGSLTKLKGVETLFDALQELNTSQELVIHIFGDGPLKEKVLKSITTLKSTIKVLNYGFKPNKEVRLVMRHMDVLVLPSHYDGWGAVINESLMSGTPAICSDACGASQLITNYMNGIIFPKGNYVKLREALEYYLDKGKTSNYEREKIKTWAENNISPLNACVYFLKKLKLTNVNPKNIKNDKLPWEPFKFDQE